MDNKNVFAMNLQRYMQESGKTRKEVCDALGFNYYTFSDWINGKKYPRMGKVEMLATYFGILKSDLIEDKSAASMLPKNMQRVTRFAPVLGTVRCGEPLLAEENIEGYMPIPYSNDGQDYFILHAVGDSMDLAGISEGDLLIVRKQPEVESSEIAIVCVNGDEATAKYYGLHGNMAILTPKSSNPENQTQVYDIKKTPVRVIGRVVKIMKDC